MPNLFIIGNGFDIAHHIPTRYSNFYSYLVEEYSVTEDCLLIPPDITMGHHGEEYPDESQVANFLVQLLGNSGINIDWNDFEEKLGEMDYDEFFDLIGDFDDDDNPFHQAYMREDISSSLLKSIPYIKEIFSNWINTIEVKSNLFMPVNFKSIISPKSDLFLNFNYTLSLEKLYGCKNICYIHGKKGEDILVGHGDISPKVGCWDADDYPGAICSLSDVKEALRKKTEEALALNEDFFSGLYGVERIYSIGFSYNDVDLVYIREICKFISSKDSIWTFHDYPPEIHQIPLIKQKIIKCGFKGIFEIQKLL